MKYDVIVIGAGNGGLTSALTLQKAGKKVLVLEAHNLPGGFATSFVRGRFEFEASLHEMCGYGTNLQHGDVYDLFSRLGILSHITFQQIPDSYHVITLDSKEEYTMPSGVNEFISQMEEYVPGSKESMQDFFALAEEVKSALSYFNESKGNPDPDILMRDYSNFMKVAPYSVQKVLDKLKMPKKAQEILTVYWTYLGSPSSQLSFVHFAMMLSSYVENGAWIPTMRSHEISLVLQEEFEKLGGKMKFLSRVVEVLFQEEHVIGVKCADGTCYYADSIVSNISPTTFYGNLLPKEHQIKRANQLCNARMLGARGISVYLGLNRSVEELGLSHYSYFIYHTLDSNQEYLHMKDLYHDSLVGVVLNNAISNASPEGTTLMVLTSFYPNDVFEKNVTDENYYAMKEKIADRLIESFEKATEVDIRSSIEEIEIATPVTFARYGGHPEGSIYGYLAKGYDNLMPRLMNQTRENYLPHVYFCGGFAARLSGFSSSYLSGEMAALQVLKDVQKEGDSSEEN